MGPASRAAASGLAHDFESLFGGGRGLGHQFSLLATSADASVTREARERSQRLNPAAISSDLQLIRSHDLALHPGLQELKAQLPDRLLRTAVPALQWPVHRVFVVLDLGGFYLDEQTLIGSTALEAKVMRLARERAHEQVELLLGTATPPTAQAVAVAARYSYLEAVAATLGKILTSEAVHRLEIGMGTEHWNKAKLYHGGSAAVRLRCQSDELSHDLALRIVQVTAGDLGRPGDMRQNIRAALDYVMRAADARAGLAPGLAP